MNTEIKAILFDLGGVLVELDGAPLKPEWLEGAISAEENWRLWGQSRLVEEFEKGAISAQGFVEGVIDELALNVSPADFTERFVSWPLGLFPEAEEVLRALQGKYLLALYSNTSELHWPRLMIEMGLQDKFDRYFASFEIGFYKPDVRGFQYIASELHLAPEQILFLDDNMPNVEAARSIGMLAEQAKGAFGVKRVLHEFGVG